MQNGTDVAIAVSPRLSPWKLNAASEALDVSMPASFVVGRSVRLLAAERTPGANGPAGPRNEPADDEVAAAVGGALEPLPALLAPPLLVAMAPRLPPAAVTRVKLPST
jgi:hypothetical protein